MIQITARATREVKIPNRHQTRAEIITLFKVQLLGLKSRLNVRENVILINQISFNFRARLLLVRLI